MPAVLRRPIRRLSLALAAVSLLGTGLATFPPAAADHTTEPATVTIAGSLQSEAGCAGDWEPACAATYLAFDAADDVWQGTFDLPAGDYEYKAALNDSWDENYGAGAVPGGDNIPLSLPEATSVKFYYDHGTHWVTDDVGSVVATAPGSYQDELGCPGDWQPDCLRSWLQDPDGDGTYAFTTADIPPGSYEFKVAIDEAWDENYGAGGEPGGANLPFTVGADATVTFSYDAATHVPSVHVAGEHAQDGNVEWDGLRHDSRDTLYRAPGGAVPAGTAVKLRFRTFHGDVTGVQLRTFSLNANAQSIVPMLLAAEDVSCYEAALADTSCDLWEATVDPDGPENLWYRFIVTDGPDTDYYGDDTWALDGGLGAPSDEIQDRSWALMFHDPGFQAPSWVRDAVIYQIFPDRFRNGLAANDPQDGDVRYDDPVVALPWGTLPEGYCRNYQDAPTGCPWRFDDTPPDWSPDIEQPRGRDYEGGDLRGVGSKLGYLRELGVTAVYFNPIFDAGSNHSYDTQNYYAIDPYFGTNQEFDRLVRAARRAGIRIILDGVFNHLSSDSPFFDRYGHYPTLGACESADSPFRDWFHFRPPTGSEPSPCAPSTPGGDDTYYDGWFGFDSIPVLDKTNPDVVAFFVTGGNSVAKHWLRKGAAAWRMDVSGDPSFPDGYWETFRDVVKAEDPQAAIISETWQKDSTLLRMVRGDRADTTMNYRLRDAVIGLLAPQSFDPKGFADSGSPIEPSQFGARMASIREDYPDAAFYSLMDLLDSHDTERLLWTLTPGAETTAEKEGDPANVAEGKRRVRLASLLQFGAPGAPTVYYGDEIGLTGDDDPDDRRAYPWGDLGGTPDASMFQHYRTLAGIRSKAPALTRGDQRILLADDAADVVAIGRKTGAQAAIVLVNRSDAVQAVDVPVAGYVPEGVTFHAAYGVGNPAGGSVGVAGGSVPVSLQPLSGLLLLTGPADLTPPAAPEGLTVTGEGDGTVSVSWDPVPGAAGYRVYRSPVSGGGYVQASSTGSVSQTSFTDTGLENGKVSFYVVRALDAAGNESADSNEVSALPHLTIGWANTQWPPSITHTISVVNPAGPVYGQAWIDGATAAPGPTPSLRAQLGFGPDGTAPATASWRWTEASFNTDAGNNDEFAATVLPESTGSFDYLYRYTTTNGRDWFYADLSGPVADPDQPAPNPGQLTVEASDDTAAPATPAGLTVTGASPSAVDLSWDPVTGDASLYGYEVLRSGTSGGPYQTLALVTGTTYSDTSVVGGQTYHYVVRAVDLSFNRSGLSNEVTATASPRTVSVAFEVTVPASTDGTGRTVHIAGTLSRLDGDLPDWDPGAVSLTRVDATHWTITLTGEEGTQIEYKYTLGDWEHVEKDAACGEIGNRLLTLSYGSNGTQLAQDTVQNWRNVPPCGN